MLHGEEISLAKSNVRPNKSKKVLQIQIDLLKVSKWGDYFKMRMIMALNNWKESHCGGILSHLICSAQGAFVDLIIIFIFSITFRLTRLNEPLYLLISCP